VRINVHAKQKVDGRDRAQLERLCRYITPSPPLAQERLTRRADGRLELELKKVWRDGTRALVLEPFDLLTRLVAARRRGCIFCGISGSCRATRLGGVKRSRTSPLPEHRPFPLSSSYRSDAEEGLRDFRSADAQPRGTGAQF